MQHGQQLGGLVESATNLETLSDSKVIHFYNQRGEDSENRITELKTRSGRVIRINKKINCRTSNVVYAVHENDWAFHYSPRAIDRKYDF
jgi:hypothetical protein